MDGSTAAARHTTTTTQSHTPGFGYYDTYSGSGGGDTARARKAAVATAVPKKRESMQKQAMCRPTRVTAHRPKETVKRYHTVPIIVNVAAPTAVTGDTQGPTHYKSKTVYSERYRSTAQPSHPACAHHKHNDTIDAECNHGTGSAKPASIAVSGEGLIAPGTQAARGKTGRFLTPPLHPAASHCRGRRHCHQSIT